MKGMKVVKNMKKTRQVSAVFMSFIAFTSFMFYALGSRPAAACERATPRSAAGTLQSRHTV
jgi:hypothetical protein